MKNDFRPYHIRIIDRELERRKKSNPRYSMRAFAKFLGMGSSTLSRILLDHQEVSSILAEKIITKIGLSEEEGVLFLASIAEDKRKRANKILSSAITNGLDDERLLPIDTEWLLSKSPELIYVFNTSKRFLYVNEEGAKLHGKVPEELIGRTLREVGTPDDTADMIEEWIELVIKKKVSLKLEHDFPTETGNKWFERIYQPVMGAEKEVQAVVCHLRDITERKNAELRLQLLVEAGKTLTSTFNTSEALSQLADLMISDFADCCVVHVMDESGKVSSLKVSHKNPKAAKSLLNIFGKYPFDPKYPAFYHHVFSSGECHFISKIDDEILNKFSRNEKHLDALKKLDIGSYICVPMKAVDRIVGTITILRSKSKNPHFEVSDLSLLLNLSARAAWMIELKKNQVHPGISNQIGELN